MVLEFFEANPIVVSGVNEIGETDEDIPSLFVDEFGVE